METLFRELVRGTVLLIAKNGRVAVSPPPSPPPQASEPPKQPAISNPGCTAADETLVVHGHLDGLAKGWGGFGVLRESAKRLERAAAAARIAGSPEISGQLASIAARLPAVRDEQAAAAAAKELDPLLPRVWELGKRCGGASITPAIRDKVRRLTEEIQQGKMTSAQAVASLRADLAKGA